ncbi:MAG: N-acetylneuraminate synthase family protein [Methylococcales bacterium]
MTDIPGINIAGRRIAPDEFPYIIAELSANHNGSLDTALKIVESAKAAGADAVKLQAYRPDTITLDCDSGEFRRRAHCMGSFRSSGLRTKVE